MKIKNVSTFILAMLLVGCSSNNSQSIEGNAFFNKTEGNADFNEPGNMVQADFLIDGVLDNEEWANPNLEINIGGTSTVPATVNAKLYFGI